MITSKEQCCGVFKHIHHNSTAVRCGEYVPKPRMVANKTISCRTSPSENDRIPRRLGRSAAVFCLATSRTSFYIELAARPQNIPFPAEPTNTLITTVLGLINRQVQNTDITYWKLVTLSRSITRSSWDFHDPTVVSVPVSDPRSSRTSSNIYHPRTGTRRSGCPLSSEAVRPEWSQFQDENS